MTVVNVLFSAVTAGVSLLLAVRLISLFRRRPTAHTFAYAAAMLLLGGAAGLDVVAALLGYWPPTLYALYWLEAGSVAAVMAVGSLYLAARPAGHVALAAALVGIGYLAVQAFGLEVAAGGIAAGPAAATQAPEGVKGAFRAVSHTGALVVLLVAASSWVRTRRAYNGLIILSVLLFAAGGIMGGRLASPALFYGLQALAAVVLYLGVAGSLSRHAARQEQATG